MRVLFTSLRNTSHFLPLVPFIDACRRRGHEVAVAAPAELSERAAATGAAFFPLAHPGDAGLMPFWARTRAASGDEARRIVIAEIFAGICATTALPDMLALLERWRPALVVRESQEYSSLLAAEKFGVAHARVAITLRGAEMDLLAAAAPAVDGHGAKLGLPPDPKGERILREPVLTLFPGSLEPPEHAAAVQVHRFRSARKPAAPPLPAWWRGQGPFVYVTLGTVAGSMEDIRSVYRVLLDALRGLEIRALLTIGNDLPMELLGVIPDNVHVERFVPQDDVLPHAAAALCHGGSGTVIGALAAGVPMVVAPLFADQPINAGRVEAIGAGLAVPMAEPSAQALRSALQRVLAEPSFAAAARRVAAEIAALPPVDAAALEIERLGSNPA